MVRNRARPARSRQVSEVHDVENPVYWPDDLDYRRPRPLVAADHLERDADKTKQGQAGADYERHDPVAGQRAGGTAQRVRCLLRTARS